MKNYFKGFSQIQYVILIGVTLFFGLSCLKSGFATMSTGLIIGFALSYWLIGRYNKRKRTTSKEALVQHPKKTREKVEFKKDKRESKENIEKHLSSTKSHPLTSDIRPDILSLLYFKNGKYRNIPDSINEPSAIDVTLPISNSTASETGYYPSYDNLTPEQRCFFIKWLKSIDSIDDLGYAFLLLYCLERHIYQNDNVDEAIKILKELHTTFDNSSFNYYSSVALVWAAHKYHKTEYLNGIDMSKLPISIRLFVELELRERLDSDEIIEMASKLGWKNSRYIKNYPKLFKKKLESNLVKVYGTNYFPKPKTSLESINSTSLLLSNYSLPNDERTLLFPDLTSNKDIGESLYNLLEKSHNDVKKYLRTHKDQYVANKKKTTTKKRINPKTGYPMSTDKQIKNAYQNYRDVSKPSQINEYMSENQIRKQKQLDFILLHFFKGDWYYKRGEWDKAEREWLKIYTLMPHAACKLAIMYRKQSRNEDELSVLNKANNSKEMQELYPNDTQVKERLRKLQNK